MSPTVVSYVLNGSNYVSEEKRKAVLDAVKELNYIPNHTARSLRNQKTYQIAVLRGNALNDMFNDLMDKMELLAYDYGYTISLLTVIRDENLIVVDSFIDKLISRRFDAVFVANNSLTTSQLNKLLSCGIKVLLYPTKDYFGLDEHISCLSPDYRNGVKMLIDMLIELGHTRIAFMPNFMYPSVWDQSNHRFDGYVNSLAAHGIPINMAYIGKGENKTMDQMIDNVKRFFDLTLVKEPPTAIYIDESVVAGTVMKYLSSCGISVPENVSIATSSDSTIARILTPRLTSIGVNVEMLAKKAFSMMIEMINGGHPESCMMEMTLHQRESVKSLI